MNVNGTGITEFDLKVIPDFKPETRLAIEWKQLSNKNYAGTDRGAECDVYECSVETYGKESYINNILEQLQANREARSNVITLSDIDSNEKIFGEDVDYSSGISATVLEFGRRNQGSWKGWGLELRLRALSPVFTGSPSFNLKYCDTGIDADGNFTINKLDSYHGVFEYLDHGADSGQFRGVFTMTAANMKGIRRYIATQRTGNFTLLDTFGISYPFGIRSENSYPFQCKLIKWADLGNLGTLYRKISLTFAEVV